MNKAIFYDRDGVLNEDTNYPYKIEDFILLPNVIEALTLLKDQFKFVIITNQSGIGRGYFTMDDFNNFNNHLLNILSKHNIKFEKTYVCPHTKEDNCDCRKPKTTFIKQAEKEFNIDLEQSFLIGDHPHDIQLGKDAGIKTILMLTGHGLKHKEEIQEKPDFIAHNLLEAAQWIMNQTS